MREHRKRMLERRWPEVAVGRSAAAFDMALLSALMYSNPAKGTLARPASSIARGLRLVRHERHRQRVPTFYVFAQAARANAMQQNGL